MLEKLNKVVQQALANPAIVQKLEALGTCPTSTSLEAFKTFVTAESAKFREISTAADIKAS